MAIDPYLISSGAIAKETTLFTGLILLIYA